MLYQFVGMIIDIETVFLKDAPKDSNALHDDAWLLLKSLYGLVQSARQFFLKFCAILLQLNLIQSNVEPCLFTKRSNDGIIFVAIYVDDCYVIGHDHMIKQLISDLKSAVLKLKLEENTSEYFIV
jgi:hypothetical protein